MDKAKIEIEKLRQEINEIEEQIKKNKDDKNNISQKTDLVINQIQNLNQDIQTLNHLKGFSEYITKNLKMKLVILILFVLISIFSVSMTCLSIYTKDLMVLPYLSLFCSSVFISYHSGKDYIDYKKKKKEFDTQNLDIKLNTAKDELKQYTLILNKNEKYDKETLEKLDLENSNLEKRKKIKEERINELSILRNNIIEIFIKDNEKFDYIVNVEYEKSKQNTKKINSGK